MSAAATRGDKQRDDAAVYASRSGMYIVEPLCFDSLASFCDSFVEAFADALPVFSGVHASGSGQNVSCLPLLKIHPGRPVWRSL